MGPDITLQPGDRVLIVSNWDNSHDFNHAGLMDKYLGTVMTIRERTPAGHYRMEEDLGEFEEGKEREHVRVPRQSGRGLRHQRL